MDQFCYLCNVPAMRLCDGKTESGTCDRPMCLIHSHQASLFIACTRGKGGRGSFTGSIDYCEDCQKKQSQPKRSPALSNWWLEQIDYYDRLIDNLMQSGLKEKEKEQPHEGLQSMRRYEIKRLRAMKKELLDRSKDFNDGNV
jgi:hypothetical protein